MIYIYTLYTHVYHRSFVNDAGKKRWRTLVQRASPNDPNESREAIVPYLQVTPARARVCMYVGVCVCVLCESVY